MTAVIQLTRVVRMSEVSLASRFTTMWRPHYLAPVFLPVACIGPMTVVTQTTCGPPPDDLTVEEDFTELQWGVLGTAGSIFVTETPETIRALMQEAS